MNSIYVIDGDNHLIKRIAGTNTPTPRQGNDGEWKEYREVRSAGTSSLLIIWGDNPDGSLKCTLTSDVVCDTEV